MQYRQTADENGTATLLKVGEFSFHCGLTMKCCNTASVSHTVTERYLAHVILLFVLKQRCS